VHRSCSPQLFDQRGKLSRSVHVATHSESDHPRCRSAQHRESLIGAGYRREPARIDEIGRRGLPQHLICRIQGCMQANVPDRCGGWMSSERLQRSDLASSFGVTVLSASPPTGGGISARWGRMVILSGYGYRRADDSSWRGSRKSPYIDDDSRHSLLRCGEGTGSTWDLDVAERHAAPPHDRPRSHPAECHSHDAPVPTPEPCGGSFVPLAGPKPEALCRCHDSKLLRSRRVG
jgi:hypothetical protein